MPLLFLRQRQAAKAGKAKEPYKELPGRDERPAALTDEQTAAVTRINRAIEAAQHEIFLLHGVTASGKTEVYLEAVAKCLQLGKTAYAGAGDRTHQSGH